MLILFVTVIFLHKNGVFHNELPVAHHRCRLSLPKADEDILSHIVVHVGMVKHLLTLAKWDTLAFIDVLQRSSVVLTLTEGRVLVDKLGQAFLLLFFVFD